MSIATPENFLVTDVLGVFTLLEEVRRQDVKRFVQTSTDEVYRSVTSGPFPENDMLDPSHPYSASRARGSCSLGLTLEHAISTRS